MDLNLQVKTRADDAIVASYTCPCGCNPRLPYERGSGNATDDCCCGNQFAVGPRASDHVRHHDPGFALELQPFQAPWGEALQAAWAIGASKDPNGSDHEQDASGHGHDDGHDHDHSHGHEHAPEADTSGWGPAASGQAIDPVCGMTVEVAGAVAKGLTTSHAGVDYYFCGKGCLLEFRDDPARFLDPSYTPAM